MRKLALVSIVALTLAISACASKPLEVVQRDQPMVPLNVEYPIGKPLVDVKWIVVTPSNAQSKVARPLICTTNDGYENLVLNTKTLEVHIRQLGDVIQAYKNYYEGPSQDGGRKGH